MSGWISIVSMYMILIMTRWWVRMIVADIIYYYPVIIQWHYKTVMWHWENCYQQDSNVVNKNHISNHYATLQIPLSQGEQEGKMDAINADKDLILQLLFKTGEEELTSSSSP